MLSATIEPPGGLSCGAPEVRMVTVPRLGFHYVRYIRYTPLALGLSAF